ncbi:hypothetical protein JOC54_004297 [Alkalihalobacillus xiaoxiensis]|uniref:Uncharacterized protein n=1 Tax=Shouchella xiaoxiensis TaxID=766895 RepID=A0ABS2SZQ1_9BACI|nr:hypothetical protein [Shouchella xiaoxiensis]MBM7840998.1 hypothetical protein [Shouchella xiaoxiensis]
MNGWFVFFIFGSLFIVSLILYKQRGNRSLLFGYGGAVIYVSVLLLSIPLFYFLPKETIEVESTSSYKLEQAYHQFQTDLVEQDRVTDSTFLVNKQSFTLEGSDLQITDVQTNDYFGAQFVITKDHSINQIEVSEYQYVSFDGTAQLKSEYLPALSVKYKQGELTISQSTDLIQLVQIGENLYSSQFNSDQRSEDFFISVSSSGMGYGQSFIDIRVPAHIDIKVAGTELFIIKEAQ